MITRYKTANIYTCKGRSYSFDSLFAVVQLRFQVAANDHASALAIARLVAQEHTMRCSVAERDVVKANRNNDYMLFMEG